jgi:peptidoglycan/LPS O-acetylase OafA/YrhL
MGATLGYRLVRDGSSPGVWRDLALFDTSGQFYFIWLLLVFGLLLTQAHRLSHRGLWAAVAAALVVNVAMVAWYESHDAMSGLFATLAYRNPLAWVFFPVLGYALGRRGLARVPGRVVAVALAGMGLSAAAYAFPGLTRDTWPVSYFGVSVFGFSACAMLVYPTAAARSLGARWLARPLIGLSRYAFPIYLVHLPFAIGLGTEKLLGDGANWSSYWLLLHANAAIGLFVPLAVVRELDKLSPWFAARVLGVRRRGPGVPAPPDPAETGARAPIHAPGPPA